MVRWCSVGSTGLTTSFERVGESRSRWARTLVAIEPTHRSIYCRTHTPVQRSATCGQPRDIPDAPRWRGRALQPANRGIRKLVGTHLRVCVGTMTTGGVAMAVVLVVVFGAVGVLSITVPERIQQVTLEMNRPLRNVPLIGPLACGWVAKPSFLRFLRLWGAVSITAALVVAGLLVIRARG